MAVAVHECLLHRQRLQFELQSSGLFFAHEEFLEQKRVLREALRLFAETVLQKFIAQRQQTRWLQPHHRHATFDERPEQLEHAPVPDAG